MDNDIIVHQLQIWNKRFFNRYVSIKTAGTDKIEYIQFKQVGLSPGGPSSVVFEGANKMVSCYIDVTSMAVYKISLSDCIQVVAFNEDEMDLWRVLSIQ